MKPIEASEEAAPTLPSSNNETFVELLEKGSVQTPHSVNTNDLLVLVEGEMLVQFYTRRASDGRLVKQEERTEEGGLVVMKKGDVQFIPAGQIVEFVCLQSCKLMHVHGKVASNKVNYQH